MSRTSIYSRLALLAGAALALPQLFACLSHPVKEVEYDKAQEAKQGVSIAVNKDVDIVFVIDDSGSMKEEQALLSANFASFINVLEADDVQANYRIAITTTDVGNPRCSKTKIPANGSFVLSSCIDRIAQEHFLFKGVNPPLDAAATCTDYCEFDDSQLTIRPTKIEGSDEEKARPWLESIEGETNIPEGISSIQAFQCFGPQGIAGCGFENPLEAMYKAFRKAERMDENNFGFVREQAILSVVFVTDEADCSSNTAWDSIWIGAATGDLSQDEVRTLWNDPADNSPTSAVCWRAGTVCQDGDCRSANVAIDGSVDVSDDDSVLYPLSRYTGLLDAYEAEKKMFDNGAEILVALIGGVPQGFSGDLSTIPYTATALPPSSDEIVEDFGIDPGCVSADGGVAVPPVRLRDFAEHFKVGDDSNIFSICDEDYSPALQSIANKIRDQIKPACMPECVKDTDPTTELLEEDCTLTETNTATGESTSIPKCVKSGDTYEPPGEDTVCYISLVDPDGNDSDNPDDDMSPECVEDGWNLEFRLFRRGPAPAGSSVVAVCQISDIPTVDCPGLFNN